VLTVLWFGPFGTSEMIFHARLLVLHFPPAAS